MASFCTRIFTRLDDFIVNQVVNNIKTAKAVVTSAKALGKKFSKFTFHLLHNHITFLVAAVGKIYLSFSFWFKLWTHQQRLPARYSKILYLCFGLIVVGKNYRPVGQNTYMLYLGIHYFHTSRWTRRNHNWTGKASLPSHWVYLYCVMEAQKLKISVNRSFVNLKWFYDSMISAYSSWVSLEKLLKCN